METYLIIFIVISIGISQRMLWTGEYSKTRPERLEGDFGFTGFQIITKFILTWPGIMPIVS